MRFNLIRRKKEMKREQKTQKVIGYLRVSSLAQVDDGTSLARQREQIEAFCKVKGFQDVQFLEDDGISGFKTTARKGYTKLIELCKKKQVDVVIVYDLSRLSRSVRETLAFVEDVIEKNHISFVSLNNDIDTTTPQGKAFLTLTATFNQLYRDEIAYKTAEALRHKQAKAEKTGGTVPYGYQAIDGKLYPVEREQEAIRLMQELREEGKSLRAIAGALEVAGYQTKTGKGSWSAKVVSDVLRIHSPFVSQERAIL